MARLLIVDNDERIVELSAWFLRRLGHAVDTANSYKAARIQMGKCWPDLMLADLDLGYERGQEELPKLANEGCLPATLVVSGFLDADLDSQLRRIPGVLGTVAKPVDLKHLEGLIRHHLENGERIPAPAPSSDPGGVEALEGLAQEDGEEDGWVEIAPLAPGINPAPATRQVLWGSAPLESRPRDVSTDRDPGRPESSSRPGLQSRGEPQAQAPGQRRASEQGRASEQRWAPEQRRLSGQERASDQQRDSNVSAPGVPDPRTRL